MYGNEGYVHEALRAGVRAYVLKESTSTELVRAVREAAAGRRYLSPPLSELAIEAYIQKTETTKAKPLEILTPRERDVLRLAAQGMTTAQIAKKLSVSQSAIQVYRAAIAHKLNISGEDDLKDYTQKYGLDG